MPTNVTSALCPSVHPAFARAKPFQSATIPLPNNSEAKRSRISPRDMPTTAMLSAQCSVTVLRLTSSLTPRPVHRHPECRRNQIFFLQNNNGQCHEKLRAVIKVQQAFSSQPTSNVQRPRSKLCAASSQARTYEVFLGSTQMPSSSSRRKKK